MPDDAIIQARDVSKLYRIGVAAKPHDSLGSAAMSLLATPFRNLRTLRGLDTAGAAAPSPDSDDDGSHLWALRDVSFDVRRGEVLGIIGHNGAGKSTLLKILARIAEPTTGRIRLGGRVAALLEIGTGFNIELTGRDNIYLNGTLLGMTRREIDRKFDEIVDFAGVERFLDTPVKRYSSGMRVRLGFGVAAHLDPDILIVDEVLSVGDAAFRAKSLGKMRDAVESGRTVILVSHQMDAILELCDRCLVMEAGRVGFDGDCEQAILRYLGDTRHAGYANDLTAHRRPEWLKVDVTRFRFTSIRLEAPPGGLVALQPLTFRIGYRAERDVEQVEIGLSLSHRNGTKLITCRSEDSGLRLHAPAGSAGELTVRIDRPYLPQGEYLVELTSRSGGSSGLDAVTDALMIELRPSTEDIGALKHRGSRLLGLRLPSSWELDAHGALPDPPDVRSAADFRMEEAR